MIRQGTLGLGRIHGHPSARGVRDPGRRGTAGGASRPRALRGASGVRDFGLLEAALFRPQAGYDPDLIAEAAGLWERLAQYPPFVDGHERTAFAATQTFLAINGVLVVADAEAAHAFIIGLHETGSFRFDQLDPWLRRHTETPREGA